MNRSGPIPKPRRGERQALKQQEKRDDEVRTAAAKRVWRASVSGVCAMCAAERHGGAKVEPLTPGIRENFHNDLVRFEGHHLIQKGDLKRMGYPPEVRYDLRLQLTLCVYHHERHEHYVERVPRELYPPVVWKFAVEHDLVWLLEREIEGALR